MMNISIPILDDVFNFIEHEKQEIKNIEESILICKNDQCGMKCNLGELYCTNCGLQRNENNANMELKSHQITNISSLPVRITAKSGKQIRINASKDYEITQYDDIYNELISYNEKFTTNNGIRIPERIIKNVTERYITFIKELKIVKRSAKKRALLGFLILDECIKDGSPRTNESIAKLLNISSNVLARGIDEFINLSTSKSKEVYVSQEVCSSHYARRYLTAMNLESHDLEKYVSFITEVFERSEKLKINVLILPTSKITGCIWYIVQKNKLKFKASRISEICDGIQKATFSKFYTTIKKFENSHFKDIIKKYFPET